MLGVSLLFLTAIDPGWTICGIARIVERDNIESFMALMEHHVSQGS